MMKISKMPSTYRRFLFFMVFLVIVIVLLTLTFNWIRSISSGGPGGVIVANKVFDAKDYASRNSYVENVVRGPIVGNDEHFSYRITVSPNSRNIDVIQGYQGKIVTSESYPNNREAYEAFMYALSKEDFGKSRNTSLVQQGSCARARVYTFKTFNEQELINDTWAGSCAKGSSTGNTSNILNLFRAQITDFRDITRDYRI